MDRSGALIDQLSGSRAAPFLAVSDGPPSWIADTSLLAECSHYDVTTDGDSVDTAVGTGGSSCDTSGDEGQVESHAPHYQHVWPNIVNDLIGKKIYVFLDYDGTLAPIVSDPSRAILADSTRQLLLDLAEDSSRVSVGIVTGRALSSIKKFVRISATENLNFVYAASHGFHIESAGQQLHHRVGARHIPALRKAALQISKRLGHVPGVTLEDNEFAVSVHYRNARAGAEHEVQRCIDDVLRAFPSIKRTQGKMVFELRINLTWDKGRAVTWLLNAMHVNPSDPEVQLIYIGDDQTDEDAFRVIRRLNNKSLAVIVSEKPNSRRTAACLSVKDPTEVAGLLRDILQVSRK